jgi:hypothetical protein
MVTEIPYLKFTLLGVINKKNITREDDPADVDEVWLNHTQEINMRYHLHLNSTSHCYSKAKHLYPLSDRLFISIRDCTASICFATSQLDGREITIDYSAVIEFEVIHPELVDPHVLEMLLEIKKRIFNVDRPSEETMLTNDEIIQFKPKIDCQEKYIKRLCQQSNRKGKLR